MDATPSPVCWPARLSNRRQPRRSSPSRVPQAEAYKRPADRRAHSPPAAIIAGRTLLAEAGFTDIVDVSTTHTEDTMRDGALARLVLNTLHTEEITHFHIACGIGSAAAGFNDATPMVGNVRARFVCIGGVDVHPGAIANFERMTGAKGTVLDLFSHDQYVRYHGHQPPPGWREATAEDFRRAAGYRRPDVVFISAPCKGNSGLISEKAAQTDKYQALNELCLRAIFLMLEAWADEGGPDILAFENVPRIRTRSRHLLDQIGRLLGAYGFAYNETMHDCGELGHLAQSRWRFLLMGRNTATVPPFLYVPPKRPLQAVGDVLSRMPLPGDPRGGPMHRIPSLQFKTWCRLAFVEAGSDWRSLNRLAVEDGFLRDYLIVPEYRRGYLGVTRWDRPACTVSGRGGPTNGAYSVSDPRHLGPPKYSNEFAVGQWSEPAGAVTGAHGSGQCVSDPRYHQSDRWHDGKAYGVIPWDRHTGTIAGQQAPGQGAYTVADPRVEGIGGEGVRYYRVIACNGTKVGANQVYGMQPDGRVPSPLPPARHLFGKYAIAPYDGPTGTVIGGADSGAYGVADPRTGTARLDGADVGRDVPADVVSCAHSSDALPPADEKTVVIIRAADGSVHRPFTTLELAAIQSMFDPSEVWSDDPVVQAEIDERNRRRGWDGFSLVPASDKQQREHIGNAVPRKTAKAIAHEIGATLLLARMGETFTLSAQEVWARKQIAIALSLPTGEEHGSSSTPSPGNWRCR